MKRKKINIGDRKIEIRAYETSFDELDERTVEEFNELLKEEERHDEMLAEMAREIWAKVKNAVMEDRAERYWEVGDVIHRRWEEIKAKGDSRAPYEVLDRMLSRVREIQEEELGINNEADREPYSVPYLRKMLRLRRIMTRQQVQKAVPYPFFHELLYSDLTREEINEFLDRCERGVLASTDQLREEVKALRYGKRGKEHQNQDELESED
jgi:hypothetical protein